MPAMWTYPWTLYEEGLDDAFETLTAHGIDRITLATHYHSVQSFQPRFVDTEALFVEKPAGCYFDPDPERFADTPIEPLPNDVAGAEDPLAEITERARDHGIDVAAWTVCMHNSRLGAANLEFCTEDAFGHAHEHAFCPSHPDVQRYFADVAAAAADRGTDEIQLESYGYPSAFHHHDTTQAHPKRHVLTSETEQQLFSLCFCEACKERADEHDVAIEEAQDTVQSIIRESFDRPHSDPAPLSSLVREHESLDNLFELRAAVIDEFLASIARAVGDADLSGYIGSDGGWESGITFESVNQRFDRAMALCYVNDPVEAREQIRTVQRELDLPIDAGVLLDPSVIERQGQFQGVVNAVRDTADGYISTYHHSMATDAQLKWIEEAIS